MILWLLFFTLLWISYTTYLEDIALVNNQALQTTNNVPAINEDYIPSFGEQSISPSSEQTIASSINNPSNEILYTHETDDLIISFNNSGDLVSATLKQFPIQKDNPNELVQLLNQNENTRYVIQSGIRSDGFTSEPNHLSQFSFQGINSLGQDYTEITFLNQDEERIATKTYLVPNSGFEISMTQSLMNLSDNSPRVMPYSQIRRANTPEERSFMNVNSYSYWGPSWYVNDRFERISFDDLRDRPEDYNVTDVLGGWVAALEHHFLVSVIPQSERSGFRAYVQDNDYILTNTGQTTFLMPQEAVNYGATLFIGPKNQDQLEAIDPQLDLAVDYGLLSFIAQPLFWVMRWIYEFVGNWGAAIIIVTLLIKTAFYRLTASAGKSMAKMRTLQPRLKSLQERFKDDRQALSRAMMDLYKKEKINPAAGCLPLFIQMPFFFAFYWVLIESVELRQQPFIFWVDDLSARDPFFILPIINCIAMVLQMRLQPTPADPTQAKVMKIMPVAFSAMFAFFPSGLVLYWTTNALFSIIQQWRINKIIGGNAPSASLGS
jgi:YidC/Oxa1 family membrane protein insertase